MTTVRAIAISFVLMGVAAAPAGAHHDRFDNPAMMAPQINISVPQAAAPPPVVSPPPPIQGPSAVHIDVVVPRTTTMLPTDVTGFQSVLRAPGVLTLPPGAPPKGPLGWCDWDKRYDFADQNWILFSDEYFTDKFGIIHHYKKELETPSTASAEPVKTESGPAGAYEARSNFDDAWTPKALALGSFIPTITTRVDKLSNTTLSLIKGAVIVRAPASAVTVHTAFGGGSSVVVKAKAVAMVSVYDDKLVVFDLTDTCCGSVQVHTRHGEDTSVVTIDSGQIAEVYDDNQQPNTNLVATRILVNKRLSEHRCLLVSQVHYIRAMKRFQLSSTLPKPELARVLKTAAAMVSLGR